LIKLSKQHITYIKLLNNVTIHKQFKMLTVSSKINLFYFQF